MKKIVPALLLNMEMPEEERFVCVYIKCVPCECHVRTCICILGIIQ